MKTALQLLDDLISELEICCADIPKVSVGAEQGKSEEKPEKSAKPAKAKKPTTAAPANPPVATEVNINSLDIRVGVITKVEKHPTAEKLYIEEIDVGEDAPRAIASGLVPYYSLEAMQGRKLLVVCNLKPRNLVGFKSHGMVLCASTHHDREVEFVDPPASSVPGDRIVGESLAASAPFSPSMVDKQKVWDTVSAGLRVDEEQGALFWQDVRLVVQRTQEGCVAPTLRNAPVK
eukprot:gene30528-36895_t